MNIGHSSRIPYDECYYPSRLYISTGPMGYYLDPNKIKNNNECLSTFGPRGSHNSFGVSTALKNINMFPAPAQQLVDVESILHNINVKMSKCRENMLNPIGVRQVASYKYDQCNAHELPEKSEIIHPQGIRGTTREEFLDPEYTHLSAPPFDYKEIAMNTFYDQYLNSMSNIWYPFEKNTRLEAKDGYIIQIPNVTKYQNSPQRQYNASRPVIVDVNKCKGIKGRKCIKS